MVHQTFRRLDEPTKLFGFSLTQWAALIIGGGGLGALLHVLAVPTRPALTVAAALIGAPAWLAYVSEDGRVSAARRLADALGAVRQQRVLEPGTGDELTGYFIVTTSVDEAVEHAAADMPAPVPIPW